MHVVWEKNLSRTVLFYSRISDFWRSTAFCAESTKWKFCLFGSALANITYWKYFFFQLTPFSLANENSRRKKDCFKKIFLVFPSFLWADAKENSRDFPNDSSKDPSHEMPTLNVAPGRLFSWTPKHASLKFCSFSFYRSFPLFLSSFWPGDSVSRHWRGFAV